jgi:RNA polymerase sigma-70 factor (ECF subfamily)
VSALDEGLLAGFGSKTQPGATSRSLIEGAARGDRESLERVCRLYGRLVWKVYLASVPEQDRMDLCQEVLLTVSQRINEFHKPEHSGPAFRAWLKTIAYHKVGNYLGRPAGLTVDNAVLDDMMQDRDRGTGNGEPADADERIELVRAAFEKAAREFEPRTVLAVRRLVLGGELLSAVAADVGMSHNALHIAKSRVLARVRSILETDLGERMGRVANS